MQLPAISSLLLFSSIAVSFLLPVSIFSTASPVLEPLLRINGSVLELDESNFDTTIASFDCVFVDFYAPWCGHCKRLDPELTKAAPILAKLKQPVVIAKVNAEKYTSLASKYEVDGFPTLKIFMHGIPTDYYGSRKADLLVRFLKKFSAPDVSILNSDSTLSEFVKGAGTYFPIFIGYGLNESIISEVALKYKKKAWFSVVKDFSKDVMALYDVEKVPALAALHSSYNETDVFYGPFEGESLKDFVKHSMFPIVVPINQDTLSLLKDDERNIVLLFVEDEEDQTSRKMTRLLKTVASINRDLVFGYVGIKQWKDFAETFDVSKKSKLPKMIVWDGNEAYTLVNGLESMEVEDEQAYILRFLQVYKDGNVTRIQISGPSTYGHTKLLLGLISVYIIFMVVVVVMLIRRMLKEESSVGNGDDIPHTNTSTSETESKEFRRSGEKED